MVLGFSWALLVIGSIYDIKYKALPRWFLIVGSILAIMLAIALRPIGFGEMAGGLFLGLLLFGISILTRGSLGKGDGIFLGILGLNLGFSVVFPVFAGALLLAAFLSILLIIVRRVNRKTVFPFLPFLSAAYGIFCAGKFM